MGQKQKSGGFKGIAVTALMLVLIASGLLAVVKSNDIDSPSDLYAFFKGYSDKIWECSDAGLEWNCDLPGQGTSTQKDGSGKTSEKSSDATRVKTDVATETKKLNGLKIGELNKVDYKRSEWKHWIGSPCNTRETVLKEQGTGVKTDAECRATAGTWVDPYSGDTFTDAGKLDIDHVIPLGYAAQAGGQSWDAAKKQQFANDTSQLLAVSASENRSKSDSGPADYMPSNKAFRCDYSKKWIDTADKYGLTITEKDKKALEKGLKTCDA